MWQEVLGILGKALGIAKPLIQDYQAQRHEREKVKRLSQYHDVLQESDPEARRDRMRGYVGRLCLDSGLPPREPLSGTSIEVPVEHFDSLIRGQCELIQVKGMLNDVLHAANHNEG